MLPPISSPIDIELSAPYHWRCRRMDPWPENGVLLRLHGGTGGFAPGHSSWLNSVGGLGVLSARLDELVGNVSSHGPVLPQLTGEDEDAVDRAVEPREDLWVAQQPASSTGPPTSVIPASASPGFHKSQQST